MSTQYKLLCISLSISALTCDHNIVTMSAILKNSTETQPKEWMFYLKSILYFTSMHSFHSRNLQSRIYFINWILHMLETSTKFVRQSLSIQPKSVGRFAHIKAPLGQLKSEDIYHALDERYCNNTPNISSIFLMSLCPNWKWVFVIDNKLGLNVSLNYIYFSSLEMPTCDWSYFGIKEGRTHNSTQVFCQQNLSHSAHNLRFCGVHSSTPLFFPKHLLSMFATVPQNIVYEVNIGCSVVDLNFTPKQEMKDRNNENLTDITTEGVDKFIFSLPERTIFVLRLSTHKMFSFCLRHIKSLHDVEFKAFDGPGTLSPVLQQYKRNNSAIILTATWKCVIHIFTAYENITSDSYFDMDYVSIQKALEKMHMNETSNTLIVYSPFNLHKCFRLCGYLFETNGNFYINISVTHVRFTGLINPGHCAFSGVSGISSSDSTITHCVRATNMSAEHKVGLHTSDEYKFPNIYSETGQIILVLYQYQEYCSLSSQIQVSTTKCQSILINLCDNDETETPKLFRSAWHGSYVSCQVFQFIANRSLKGITHQWGCFVEHADIDMSPTFLALTALSGKTPAANIQLLGFFRGEGTFFIWV